MGDADRNFIYHLFPFLSLIMEKIILASQSPRRKQLLEWAEIPFEIKVKSTDEHYPFGLTPEEVAIYIARNKALAVRNDVHNKSIILAADTIVVLGESIIGKPVHREEAVSILLALSGQKHKVITGVVLLKEEKEIGLPAAGREKVFAGLAAKSPKQKLWRGTFCLPIDVARITCDFGTIRTTQEKGRYVHKALDLINLPRSVVWATQAGVIVLKDRYEDTGNTIIIDHGFGLLSLFYHLEDFAAVDVGQTIAQGNPIGTIGKTGYATGYHLHWEMRLNNIAIDPMQWTKPTF